ncbi:MAG: MCE family protein [Rhodococcus sp. (in: high G+C Gram-positive bacteria)]|uniref:MCE family protein n=1 Tax=Rhodococcus sp. TaxID=1831 RepID=UPI003BAF96D2
MRENVRGALVRFLAFFVVCTVALFGVIVIFGQLRFDDQAGYSAEFTTVSGLKPGEFVRIAGVEVGKVKSIDLRDDNTAVVNFALDSSVTITEGTKAAVRYENLIGDRYMALEDSAGSIAPVATGYTIPVDRTSPALDLDALLGGFRPLFRALDPDQVNDLTGQLISVFQGQGGTIASVLAHTAELTNTLADRDALIGSVVDNLNTVLGTITARNEQFSEGVDTLQQLVSGLASGSPDLGQAVSSIDAAASTVDDLLTQARAPLKEVVTQTERTAGQIDSDRDYVDNLIANLPNIYQILARQGINGDFFSFYLCDLVLKVNGPGGNPVYIKVAGQDTGRCEPK